MNIGEAARASGLPTKTVRYYADIGLVTPERRTRNRYRDYSERDLHKLRFVAHARAFNFAIEECRELLSLYEDRGRSSADVKRLAKANLHRIERQMAELRALHDELERLVDACNGDRRPDCPILDGLAHAHSGSTT